MTETTRSSEKDKPPSKLTLFLRLTRFQFIPLIILPAIVGTALAYSNTGRINFAFLGLVLLGVIFLHLGANAVDDCYDYQNGVDQIANTVFPKDFGGWKPLPRGYLNLKDAKLASFALFALSLAIAAFFWVEVGVWAFILGLAGVALAILYCAPPLKLDYRGYGLGELSIFLSFGPIVVLGAYYVQTGTLGIIPLLISIPVGIMTVTILIDHDLIFYEVYSRARKLSLGTVLGRRRTLVLSLILTALSYLITIIFVTGHFLPTWSLIAPLSAGLLLLRKGKTFGRPQEAPPFYVPFTENALLADWLFTLILALTVVLGK